MCYTKIMRINVKKSENVSLPAKATSKSAAYDVVAISEPEIVGEQYPDGGWKRIDYIQYDTGLITAPQDDNYGRSYHILIHPRSSVSKYNLLLANSIGLVDNDYRKNILVRYKYMWQPEDFKIVVPNPDEPRSQSFTKINDTLSFIDWQIRGFINENKIYKKGDRVAQLISEPTTDADWVYVEDVDVTERTGGFGSTDNFPITGGFVSEFTPAFIPINSKVTSAPIIKQQPQVKSYETKTDLIEQWKNIKGPAGNPTPYEQLIREREKHLNS